MIRHCEHSEAIQLGNTKEAGLPRRLCLLAMTALLVVGMSACGNKGKLKSPTQIEIAAQKKARKEAAQKKDADDAASEDKPAGDATSPSGAPVGTVPPIPTEGK